MKASELRKWIDSLTQDIDFEYRGTLGSICPFNREKISLCFDGEEVTVDSVDAAMAAPFIEGHSLTEICEELALC